MLSNDAIFIFTTCGVLIVLPIIIAIAVIWFSRRRREQESDVTRIPTEYGWLKQFPNGDLATGFNQGQTLTVIGLVGAGLGSCWVYQIGRSFSNPYNSFGVPIALTAICIPVFFIFFRILFQKTLYIDSTQRMIEVRRIGTRRQMPASDAASFVLKEWQTRSRYGGRPVFWGKLSLKLKSGEVVDVGTTTTMAGASELKARCAEIGALVSSAAGVSLEINSQ